MAEGDVPRGKCCISVIFVLVVGFTVGILIGIYAVPHGKSETPAPPATTKSPPKTPHEVMDILTADNFEDKPEFTQQLLGEIDAKGIEKHLLKLTKRPHLAGREASHDVAEYIKDIWTKQKLEDVEMESYEVLLSYPGEEEENEIELVRADGKPDKPGKSPLKDAILHREIDKPFIDDDFPDAFHAYSPPGIVQGELVYANYATESDFDKLEDKNISVKGRIVIARYGRIFRGNKVENAAKRGALGVILYTDPEEVAPEGPNKVFNKTKWLPGDGMQRGSVYEKIGDPLTPGLPAISDVYRLDITEADLPKIPSQPIGYKNARDLMQHMSGAVIKDDDDGDGDEDWAGKLGIVYKTGPGFEGNFENYEVKMSIHNEYKLSPIFNVIARITGDIEPDRYVIVGSAHDAWGYGYVNPSSGTAQLLEITEAFSKLKKNGWKPRRTIIFCTWDASKYGQIGSTEWVEEHLPELTARTVAYINCESCIETEDIRVSASPILRQAVIDVARLVPAPDDNDHKPNETIFDEWTERDDDKDGENSLEHGRDDYDMDGDINDDDDDIVVSPLGAESDHAAFAFYAGIPSIDVHADDEGTANFFPAENTAYDVRQYLEKFVDPEYKRSVACAEYVAVMTRYLADKEILPYDVDYLGDVLKATLEKVKGLKVHKELIERNITLFDDLEEAVDEFEDATEEFNKRLDDIDEDDPIAVRVINDQMMYLERVFIKPSGQADDWFHRHLLFGPSDLDKYSDSIFPDLMDLAEEIDEIEEEESDEEKNEDSDEGKDTDIDTDEHWDEIEIYVSDLLVAVKQATRFLKPFETAYDEDDD